MTKRIGDVVVIHAEGEQQCDYCGTIAELRPYGKDGAAICFECAMKPENMATTKEMLAKLMG
jgi:hypothetical protein